MPTTCRSSASDQLLLAAVRNDAQELVGGDALELDGGLRRSLIAILNNTHKLDGGLRSSLTIAALPPSAALCTTTIRNRPQELVGGLHSSLANSPSPLHRGRMMSSWYGSILLLSVHQSRLFTLWVKTNWIQ
jgi:hypothetical protein